jgi:DNA-binding NarL/FixJ family response regulator
MKLDEYLNQLFTSLARRHGFNPLVLKEIIILNNRGYNNQEIASMLGISRNTVSSYLKKLQKLDTPDFMRLVIYALLAEGGLFFLPEEVKSESSEVYAG